MTRPASNDTLSLLQALPNLQGHHLPDDRRHRGCCRVPSKSVNKGGKVALTGLGTPNQMRKYVEDGTVQQFALWDPGKLRPPGRSHAAALLVQGKITGAQGQTFTAGSLGSYTIGANGVVLLGPPTIFDKSNIGQFNF